MEAEDAAAVRRMDRKRVKKMSNQEWVNPNDPEAEIARLKDGRTALAYKAEQAADMESGAIVAVTTHGGATGDTESIGLALQPAAWQQPSSRALHLRASLVRALIEAQDEIEWPATLSQHGSDKRKTTLFFNTITNFNSTTCIYSLPEYR